MKSKSQAKKHQAMPRPPKPMLQQSVTSFKDEEEAAASVTPRVAYYKSVSRANDISLEDVVRVAVPSAAGSVRHVVASVRYIGCTTAKEPVVKYIGLELSEAVGDCDGAFVDSKTGDKVRVFQTAPKHALFYDVQRGFEKIAAGRLLLSMNKHLEAATAQNRRLFSHLETMQAMNDSLMAQISQMDSAIVALESEKLSMQISLQSSYAELRKYDCQLKKALASNIELCAAKQQLVELARAGLFSVGHSVGAGMQLLYQDLEDSDDSNESDDDHSDAFHGHVVFDGKQVAAKLPRVDSETEGAKAALKKEKKISSKREIISARAKGARVIMAGAKGAQKIELGKMQKEISDKLKEAGFEATTTTPTMTATTIATSGCPSWISLTPDVAKLKMAATSRSLASYTRDTMSSACGSIRSDKVTPTMAMMAPVPMPCEGCAQVPTLATTRWRALSHSPSATGARSLKVRRRVDFSKIEIQENEMTSAPLVLAAVKAKMNRRMAETWPGTTRKGARTMAAVRDLALAEVGLKRAPID